MSLRPFMTVGIDTITPSDKATSVGVTFDTHLTLSYHVNDEVITLETLPRPGSMSVLRSR